MENIMNKMFSLFFIILLVGLYFSSIIFSYFVIKMDLVAMFVIIMGIIALILYLFNSIRLKTFKVWNILVFFIILGLYLSYSNAFDQYVALRGYNGGREGIFVIISYYMFFLLSTTIESKEIKNKIITIFTICGIFNVIYGFMQVLDIEYIFNIPVARNWNVASGFVYNPDFMGTYMIMLLGIWLPRYFYYKEKKTVSLIMSLIFISGVIISGTMGSFLTMIILMIFIIIYLLFNRELLNKALVKRYILIVMGIVSIFMLVNNFINKDMGAHVGKLSYELGNTIIGNVDESFGTGRIYIWREALKYYPKYIMYGIGIDNFAYLGFNDGTYIFDSVYKDTIIYKAHNEYLQILVCEGLVTFIPYIIFLILIFLLVIKNIKYYEGNEVYLSFMFVFFGYIIQAFFNIRILMIAPIFFAILGFLVNESVWKNRKS